MLPHLLFRTRILAVGSALAVVAVCCQGAAAAELTYPQFKRVCRRGVADKTVPVFEVEVMLTPEFVESNIGMVVNPSLSTAADHPISVLRQTQVGIESLRQYAGEARWRVARRRMNFWATHLRDADRIVADALRQVQQQNINNDAKLTLARKAQSDVIDEFENALQRYAGQTGRKYEYGAPCALPPEIHFTAKTDPPDRAVQLLLLGDYILWREGEIDTQAKTIDESTLWANLEMPEAAAYGVFYYRLVETRDRRKYATPFDRLRRKDIIREQNDGVIIFD